MTEQERLEVALHGGFHQIGALRERATAIAIKPALVGDDLNDRQPHTRRGCLDHLNVFDLGSRNAANCAIDALLSFLLARSDQAGQTQPGDRFQYIATVHVYSPFSAADDEAKPALRQSYRLTRQFCKGGCFVY